MTERSALVARLLFSGRAPRGIAVPCGLNLSSSRIRRLPEEFRVEGYLDLRQCERLRVIGDGLSVMYDLFIGGPMWPHSNVQRLVEWWAGRTFDGQPERLPSPDLARTMALSTHAHCPLRALPARMQVGHVLTLRDCLHLTTLPSDLQVGRELVIAHCNALVSIPKGIRIGRGVTLQSCSALRELPTDWHVHRDLVIDGARSLASLPRGLRVDGSLRVTGTRIERLPDDLVVGGSVVLRSMRRLVSLGTTLTVPKDLTIQHASRLNDLATERLTVGGKLFVDTALGLERVTSNITVEGDLAIDEAPRLTQWTGALRVGGAVTMRGCDLMLSPPPDAAVSGAIAHQPLPERERVRPSVQAARARRLAT